MQSYLAQESVKQVGSFDRAVPTYSICRFWHINCLQEAAHSFIEGDSRLLFVCTMHLPHGTHLPRAALHGYGSPSAWLRTEHRSTFFACLKWSVIAMQSHLTHNQPRLPLEAHEHARDERKPHEPAHSLPRCASFGQLAEQSPLAGQPSRLWPNNHLINQFKSAGSETERATLEI